MKKTVQYCHFIIVLYNEINVLELLQNYAVAISSIVE